MPSVLTINGGSSSIRFAVFDAAVGASPGGDAGAAGAITKRLHGKIERIGMPNARFSVSPGADGAATHQEIVAADHRAAIECLMDWLETHPVFGTLAAVGHRIVNGMRHSAPERVTPALLAELRAIGPFDPEHLPSEIAFIEAVAARHPMLLQVACFDTAFHRDMPAVAKCLPIPARYAQRGVERYGFHGLSYEYLVGELRTLGDPAAGHGRVILAHLGNGASLAAVLDGKSVDTTMAFTPASGIVMSSRSGDLDPGIGYYLAETEGMSAAAFNTMVNHESGLLGISGTSSDVRDLLAREAAEPRASLALAVFCRSVTKAIGALAAVLGGLDALVFSGGIGENAAVLRARICASLGFLGVELDAQRNRAHAPLISADAGGVRVRVIATDEELMVARQTLRLIGGGARTGVDSHD
jgi:acetate kinase